MTVNVVKVFSVASGLASVSRYSMIALGRRESVLEHLGMVSLTANLLATQCNLIYSNCVDAGWVALKASVHDIDELVTGDIPRPTKYYNKDTRDMFRVIEERGVRKVTLEMCLVPELQAEVIQAHRQSKKEHSGAIVAVADVMAVCYKVWEEVLVRGNMSMAEHAVNVEGQLKFLRDDIHETFVGHRIKAGEFLIAILNDCSELMVKAAAKRDAIHGAIKEEMINNSHAARENHA